jgi:cell wall-associated NlpC family hydrolase
MNVFDIELSKVGAPYLYAAFGPDHFDCVGLQKWAFRYIGREDLVDNSYTVGHLADMYRFTGRATTLIPSAAAGDFVVFGHYNHVGLRLPDGRIISARVNGVGVHGLMDCRYDDGSSMPPQMVLHTGYAASLLPPAPGPTPPGPAPMPTFRRHTVLRGETLWGIAAAMLGSGQRWPELVALNPGVVPANPHLLRAGVTIRVPLI